MKLVVAVRTDLKMGKGKIAAQVGHASVEAALGAQRRDRNAFETWMDQGQPKVVVKVSDHSALQKLKAHAGSMGVPVSVVRDAGRTQIEPGSVTCLALGPAADDTLDRITGDLKLL